MNLFVFIKKNVVKWFYKKTAGRIFVWLRQNIEQMDNKGELKKLYPQIEDCFYSAYAKDKELKSVKKSLSLQQSPYRNIHDAVVKAIEAIHPNVAVTLNYNATYSLNSAKNKLDNFIQMCRQKYGGDLQGYAVFEHINSNIHAHLALHIPKKMTNKVLYETEIEMNAFWQTKIKSGTSYVRKIHNVGWFWYMAKGVKNLSHLIPL